MHRENKVVVPHAFLRPVRQNKHALIPQLRAMKLQAVKYLIDHATSVESVCSIVFACHCRLFVTAYSLARLPAHTSWCSVPYTLQQQQQLLLLFLQKFSIQIQQAIQEQNTSRKGSKLLDGMRNPAAAVSLQTNPPADAGQRDENFGGEGNDTVRRISQMLRTPFQFRQRRC